MENSKKNLTKAELNVMNILWDKGQATVSEIIGEMSEPKPAYTTVLTVMQVLTRKEVVQPERQGKAHVFRPLLSREEYIDGFLNETRDTVFKGTGMKTKCTVGGWWVEGVKVFVISELCGVLG